MLSNSSFLFSKYLFKYRISTNVLTVNDVGKDCLLYTSDAADDLLCVDLGGRRIIKKKNKIKRSNIYK